MWRLLPNVLCNKSTGCLSERKLFFLQLLLLVFIIHLLLFTVYGLAMVVFATKEKFNVSLTNKPVTYVLLPVQHYTQQKSQLSAPVSASSLQKKSKVISLQTYQEKKAAKDAKKQSASSVPSSQKGTSVLNQTVSVKIADQALKSKSKKQTSSTIVHETVTVEIEQVTDQPVPIPKTKEVQDNGVTKADPVVEQAEVPAVQDSAEQFHEDDVIFVGSQDLHHHMVASKIQQTIQQCWNVPVGMNQATSCEIQVKVNDTGKVMALSITKSSGILVYDSCARKTLKKIEYPQEVWNKTITIVLGAT